MSDTATASPAVTVTALPPQGMVSLRADLSDKGVAKAVKKATGIAPPDWLSIAAQGGTTLLWMSPDELLALCPHDDAPELAAALTEALGAAHALVADVSDARVAFRLSGEVPALRETLSKLAPADLGPDAFPEGRVRRTRLAQVAAALWLDGGEAHVICFRSVAAYVEELLKTAAAPGGEVGYF